MFWQFTAVSNGYFLALKVRHPFAFCNPEQHTGTSQSRPVLFLHVSKLKEGIFTYSPLPAPAALN